jgi:hypothetical protein
MNNNRLKSNLESTKAIPRNGVDSVDENPRALMHP